MNLTLDIIRYPLAAPFSITGYTFTETATVRVTLEQGGVAGRGEAVGVYYLGETAKSLWAQLEAVRDDIEKGISFEDIQQILPLGGARNALDCALWDLKAKQSGTSVWKMLSISPQPLTTVYTIGVGSVRSMASAARASNRYPHLKVKLDADQPIDKLSAIRLARPDAQLIIDVNQGWSFEELQEYAVACKRLDVAMIEQPLRRGDDTVLDDYSCPIPLGADESFLDIGDYEAAARRYDVLNIKLDKCGGLTSGLELVGAALRDGKSLMVGNMTGSSLSMAPSYVIGQFCRFVDIDGPLLLQEDIEQGLFYSAGGKVEIPNAALWG